MSPRVFLEPVSKMERVERPSSVARSRRIFLRWALAQACILGLAALGCATESAVDEHWGESYRELTQRQIENPNAAEESPAVTGLGSTSADHVSAAYGERRSRSEQDSRIQTSTLDQIGN